MINHSFSVISILIFIWLSGVCAENQWSVISPEKKGAICLLAEFSAKLIFINGKNETSISLTDRNITSDGECNSTHTRAHLDLVWGGYNGGISVLQLWFNSSGSGDDKEVLLDEIHLILNENKDLKIELQFNNSKELSVFNVKQKYGFQCNNGLRIHYNDSLAIDLEGIRWEVFRNPQEKKVIEKEFINTPKKCESDVKLSKSAPIIAGIVLGGLAVVVVGFLIFGRMKYRRLPDKY